MRVAWGSCTRSEWCKLNSVDLSHQAFDGEGVYVIWHGGEKAAVVYVGQGNFRDRLSDHRDDARIQTYANRGLYTTWATVDADKRDGVESYLSQAYAPLVGERHPAAKPISVNLPWD